MWILRQAWDYLVHWLCAKTARRIHSPYLFDLLSFIHDKHRLYYPFETIEWSRTELLTMEDPVERVELGAGSRTQRRLIVKDIARTSLSSVGKCQLLFRLVTYTQPKTILELGTSLGIMSAYLAAANRAAEVHTIEGNPSLARIAQKVANAQKLNNIRIYTGSFLDRLPEVLREAISLDLVHIDGDHRGTALLEYYAMLKPVLSENAIVIVDDIRWSRDMYTAWQRLKEDPDVTCTLDYFHYGLLFYRKDFLEKIEHRMRG